MDVDLVVLEVAMLEKGSAVLIPLARESAAYSALDSVASTNIYDRFRLAPEYFSSFLHHGLCFDHIQLHRRHDDEVNRLFLDRIEAQRGPSRVQHRPKTPGKQVSNAFSCSLIGVSFKVQKLLEISCALCCRVSC